MVAQALDTFGGLHGVIAPAGILRDAMFHKMAEEDWDQVIAVHVKGSFNVARASIEHFRDQQDGAYVLFTSTSGLIGNIGQANYAAATQNGSVIEAERPQHPPDACSPHVEHPVVEHDARARPDAVTSHRLRELFG